MPPQPSPQQFAMRATFNDAAVVEHQHEVGVPNRANGMGHLQNGEAAEMKSGAVYNNRVR